MNEIYIVEEYNPFWVDNKRYAFSTFGKAVEFIIGKVSSELTSGEKELLAKFSKALIDDHCIDLAQYGDFQNKFWCYKNNIDSGEEILWEAWNK